MPLVPLSFMDVLGFICLINAWHIHHSKQFTDILTGPHSPVSWEPGIITDNEGAQH